MQSSPAPIPPLRLEPIAGPEIAPVVIERPPGPMVLGRSAKCDVILSDPDETVSRRHAEISYSGGNWWVNDLGSKHGTILNGVRLNPNSPTQLRARDRLRIGPWTFRATLTGAPDSTERLTISDDRHSTTLQVQKVSPPTIGADAQRRLDLLMECGSKIAASETEEELAFAALDALIAGTGFPRAAMLRLEGTRSDQIQIVAARGIGPATAAAHAKTDSSAPESGKSTGEKSDAPSDPPSEGSAPRSSSSHIGSSIFASSPSSGLSGIARAPGYSHIGFSRSLLQAASEGQPAVLNAAGSAPDYGQSVMSLGITSALCVPVVIDEEPDAFLYLDARRPDSGPRSGALATVGQDVISFCQAVAKLSGLALGKLERLRRRKDELEQAAELEAARAVQGLIMPSAYGSAGRLSYHMCNIPGQRVAGDLFDFFSIDESRVAVFVGDVSGKGAAAGMLMSNVQAHIRRLLCSSGDPAASLNDVCKIVADYANRHCLLKKSNVPMFITLWAGVFDTAACSLNYVDAGHAYWIMRRPGAALFQPKAASGFFLGVDPSCEYRNETTEFPSGTRIVLYTDGVKEQRGVDGTQFGFDRAEEAVAGATCAKEDVDCLLRALTRHAKGNAPGDPTFNDDVTIASIAMG